MQNADILLFPSLKKSYILKSPNLMKELLQDILRDVPKALSSLKCNNYSKSWDK
jgi:hypothetical protein